MTVMRFIFVVLSTIVPMSIQPLLAEEDPLRIAGSTTMQPIIAQAAKEFTEKYQTWNNVDPRLPSTPIVIQTASGGSSVGISVTIEGKVQIGLVSRSLKEKEKQALGEHQVFMIGHDAVIIAAHRKNPLVDVKKSFTMEELGALFSGDKHTYRDWDPSLPDQEIQLLSRDLDSGISGVLEEQVLKGKPFARHIKVFPKWPDLIKELQSVRQAISYVSAGIIRTNASLFSFAVDGVTATDEAILQGRYPLARPMSMLVKGKPELRVQKFIDHMLSEGQKLMADHHFLPISEASGR